ncbi:MAG: hypothetical protein RSB38_06240 [Oscillospiraceae bacterium]
MEKKCTNCIWADDCGCGEPCGDFSPIDEFASNEAFYLNCIKERESEYAQIVEEYK